MHADDNAVLQRKSLNISVDSGIMIKYLKNVYNVSRTKYVSIWNI